MGKAARRRRQTRSQERTSKPRGRQELRSGRPGNPRTEAEAAMGRLIRGNAPGKVSLAGAYALGFGVLGVAQQEGGQPGW